MCPPGIIRAEKYKRSPSVVRQLLERVDGVEIHTKVGYVGHKQTWLKMKEDGRRRDTCTPGSVKNANALHKTQPGGWTVLRRPCSSIPRSQNLYLPQRPRGVDRLTLESLCFLLSVDRKNPAKIVLYSSVYLYLFLHMAAIGQPTTLEVFKYFQVCHFRACVSQVSNAASPTKNSEVIHPSI